MNRGGDSAEEEEVSSESSSEGDGEDKALSSNFNECEVAWHDRRPSQSEPAAQASSRLQFRRRSLTGRRLSVVDDPADRATARRLTTTAIDTGARSLHSSGGSRQRSMLGDVVVAQGDPVLADTPSASEWIARLQCRDDLREGQRRICRQLLMQLRAHIPEVREVEAYDHVRLMDALAKEVEKAQQEISRRAYEFVAKDSEELARLRGECARSEDKLARMNKSYLQEISQKRDTFRVQPEEVVAATRAVEAKHIEFYQPMQFLSTEQQSLCLAIVDEKLQALFAVDPTLPRFANGLELQKFEQTLSKDRLTSFEKLNASLQESVRDMTNKLKKEEKTVEKLEWEIANLNIVLQKAQADLSMSQKALEESQEEARVAIGNLVSLEDRVRQYPMQLGEARTRIDALEANLKKTQDEAQLARVAWSKAQADGEVLQAEVDRQKLFIASRLRKGASAEEPPATSKVPTRASSCDIAVQTDAVDGVFSAPQLGASIAEPLKASLQAVRARLAARRPGFNFGSATSIFDPAGFDQCSDGASPVAAAAADSMCAPIEHAAGTTPDAAAMECTALLSMGKAAESVQTPTTPATVSNDTAPTTPATVSNDTATMDATADAWTSGSGHDAESFDGGALSDPSSGESDVEEEHHESPGDAPDGRSATPGRLQSSRVLVAHSAARGMEDALRFQAAQVPNEDADPHCSPKSQARVPPRKFCAVAAPDDASSQTPLAASEAADAADAADATCEVTGGAASDGSHRAHSEDASLADHMFGPAPGRRHLTPTNAVSTSSPTASPRAPQRRAAKHPDASHPNATCAADLAGVTAEELQAEARLREALEGELARTRGALHMVVSKNKELQEMLVDQDKCPRGEHKVLLNPKERGVVIRESAEWMAIMEQKTRAHEVILIQKAQLEELSRENDVVRMALEASHRQALETAKRLRNFEAEAGLPEEIDALLARMEKSRAAHHRLHRDGRAREVAAGVRQRAMSEAQEREGAEMFRTVTSGADAVTRGNLPRLEGGEGGSKVPRSTPSLGNAGVNMRVSVAPNGALPPLTSRSARPLMTAPRTPGRSGMRATNSRGHAGDSSVSMTRVSSTTTDSCVELQGNLAIGTRGGFALVGGCGTSIGIGPPT